MSFEYKRKKNQAWPAHYQDGRKKPAHDFDKPNYTHIAKACGVSIMHISRIMRGLANPSVPLLDKMAVYFGMPMSRIWEKLKAKKPMKVARSSKQGDP